MASAFVQVNGEIRQATPMIQVGRIYPSRAYSNVSRKVIAIRGGIVTYSIVMPGKPEAPFRRICSAIESEFMAVSKEPL